MTKQMKLEQLFVLWRQTHIEHSKILGLEYPDRFLPDGIAGDELSYESASPKVLYILKESNVKDQSEGDYFWFRREQSANNRTHQIIKRIAQMQRIIAENDDLNSIAYMNINKSGGDSKTKNKDLELYALNEYIAPLIIAEIQILSPDIIVCCGCCRIIKKLLMNVDVPTVIIDMWHPSYHYVSDDKYIAKFNERYEQSK